MAGLMIFRQEAPEPQENDKLVDLFRNRAELKKEFAALRNEKYQLQDRIKEHRGATARVEQRLAHLESLLLDPEWVHNVVAFYQLRRLAAHCQKKIERFAEQLKQQREQRNHGKLIESWNHNREEKAAEIQTRLGELRLSVQLLEDQLQAERHRLMTMGGVSRFFRGRSRAAEIDAIGDRIAAGQQRERELLHELQAIENLPPPDQQGLEIPTKRGINFMILAFAQQLYLHYRDDDLALLAKEASEKSVGAINYGGKQECDTILSRLNERRDEAENADGFADVLQQRARLIAEHAMFRHDDDPVPVPASVSTVFDIDSRGAVKTTDANLLGENFFGLAKMMSR